MEARQVLELMLLRMSRYPNTELSRMFWKILFLLPVSNVFLLQWHENIPDLLSQ